MQDVGLGTADAPKGPAEGGAALDTSSPDTPISAPGTATAISTTTAPSLDNRRLYPEPHQINGVTVARPDSNPTYKRIHWQMAMAAMTHQINRSIRRS